MGPPLLKIHHPLDNVSPGAKVMRRGGSIFYRVYIKTLWNRMILYSPYSPGPFCTPLDLFVLPVLYSPLGSTLFVNLIELGKLIMS